MMMLQVATKGRYMNTLEKFYIQNISKKGIQINKTYSELINPIYLMKTYNT
jgi:hypothetical protein